MAQLYDFNPVKGNVKEIRSVVYNKDKSINYESLLKIGRDGCIDSFALNQKKDEYLSGVHNYLFVERVKNKLVGRDNNGKLIYRYNKEGIIIGSVLADNKTKFSENNYNEFKLPTTIKYYKDNKVISETIITYGKDITKPFDLLMKIRVLGQTILQVDSKCDYNSQNIAHKCHFELTINENGQDIKLIKDSTTEVSFY